MYRVPVYAHRGASAVALENSFPAFVKAKELGADGLEIDIQLTKDGVPVVMHDLDFWRLGGNLKQVTDLSYDEVKKIRLGKNFWRKFNGLSVLTFEEVLQFAVKHGLFLNVELKESFVDAPDLAYQLFKRSFEDLNIHFSSFHYEVLERIKSCNPLLETALIGTKLLDFNQLTFLSAADAIHMHKRHYKIEKLNLAALSNKNMRFYGIDGHEKFIRHPHPIVVGWITDYPDRIIEIQKGILLS